jgi:hypothetical protein
MQSARAEAYFGDAAAAGRPHMWPLISQAQNADPGQYVTLKRNGVLRRGSARIEEKRCADEGALGSLARTYQNRQLPVRDFAPFRDFREKPNVPMPRLQRNSEEFSGQLLTADSIVTRGSLFGDWVLKVSAHSPTPLFCLLNSQ